MLRRWAIIVRVVAAITALGLLLPVVQAGNWEKSALIEGRVTTADVMHADAEIKITPQSLNAGSNGDPIEVQMSFSRNRCSHRDVRFDSITLRVEDGSAAINPYREITRNKSKLIVRFDRQDVIDLVGYHSGDSVTIEVRGEGLYWCKFSGSDTLTFIQGDPEIISVSSEDGTGSGGDVVPESTGSDPVDGTETTETDGESGSEQPSTDGDSVAESTSGDDASSGESSDGSDGSGSGSSDKP